MLIQVLFFFYSIGYRMVYYSKYNCVKKNILLFGRCHVNWLFTYILLIFLIVDWVCQMFIMFVGKVKSSMRVNEDFYCEGSCHYPEVLLPFPGVSQNRVRQAQSAAASVYFYYTPNILNVQLIEAFLATPCDRTDIMFDGVDADEIARLCYERFNELPRRGKPEPGREWTLLAAVVRVTRCSQSGQGGTRSSIIYTQCLNSLKCFSWVCDLVEFVGFVSQLQRRWFPWELGPNVSDTLPWVPMVGCQFHLFVKLLCEQCN